MATDISATTTITFEQLTKYFHLPINDVAKELGICATMLKKICRKNGIPRWPHRKIKSLNKMIENLEASLQNNASEAEECIRQEINILKNKKSLIMKNPSILVQGSNKRASTDADGKVVKKLRTDDDMPIATVTVPRSSLVTPSSSSSLSINQLLTPSNPFSTPLTSYLMGGEDKDEKESPRRGDEVQMMRPPSPNTQHYYKTSVQQSPMQQASRYYLPQEYSHRAGTDYLSSQPSYVQQPQTSTSQDSHYVLPKLNFSSNNGTQPTTSYMASSPPKFRPPSPINSSHQLQHQQASSYAPASPDSYSRHYFHHYHSQLSSPATAYKMQYHQQQQQPPQQSQQVAMPQQMIAQQSASGAPVVLRWVMEYDKSKK